MRVCKGFVDKESTLDELEQAATIARKMAFSHLGSGDLDGSGNTAVSASNAFAPALSGRAIVAAEYAAFAKVYSNASYAVFDPEAYMEEINRQYNQLKTLYIDYCANNWIKQ